MGSETGARDAQRGRRGHGGQEEESGVNRGTVVLCAGIPISLRWNHLLRGELRRHFSAWDT